MHRLRGLGVKICLGIFVCILMLPFNAGTVHAADISTWCYGNVSIVGLDIDETGLVWAIGYQGQIATFNGVVWSKVSDTAITTVLPYNFTIDAKNKVAYGVSGSNLNNSSRMLIKWTPSTGWQNVFELDKHGPDPAVYEYVFDKDGNVWVLLTTTGTGARTFYLKKWDGSTYVDILNSTHTTIANMFSDNYIKAVTGFTYNNDENYLVITAGNNIDNTHYIKYDINTGDVSQLFPPSTNTSNNIKGINYFNGSYYAIRTSNSAIVKRESSGTWNQVIGSSINYGGLWVMGDELYVIGRSDYGGSYIAFIIDPIVLQLGGQVTLPFNNSTNKYIRSAVMGKYGEVYLGGDSGRFGIQMNTAGYTDSSIFTDYRIGEVKEYAIEAKDAAIDSKTYSLQAKTAAETAAIKAQTTLEAVSNTNGDTITAVRDSESTALEEARKAKEQATLANTKIDSMATKITNIENMISNNDTTPPTIKLKTVSGAMATTGVKIATYVIVTDNSPGPYLYSINGGVFNTLPANGIVELPITKTGNNTILVKVKDQAGNEATDAITIRGL